MKTISQPGAMKRKSIFMPGYLIEKVERIAKDKNVSFAEVVRNGNTVNPKSIPKSYKKFYNGL